MISILKSWYNRFIKHKNNVNLVLTNKYPNSNLNGGYMVALTVAFIGVICCICDVLISGVGILGIYFIGLGGGQLIIYEELFKVNQ